MTKVLMYYSIKFLLAPVFLLVTTIKNKKKKLASIESSRKMFRNAFRNSRSSLLYFHFYQSINFPRRNRIHNSTQLKIRERNETTYSHTYT